jgi:large subunit ribosomal protein L17
MTEKLVTIAKKGDLASRRLVISRLNDIDTANLLVDVIAPQISRNSGYLRITHAGYRRGDNAEMGTIEFVDEFDFEKFAKPEKKNTNKAVKPAAKTTKVAKKEDK